MAKRPSDAQSESEPTKKVKKNTETNGSFQKKIKSKKSPENALKTKNTSNFKQKYPRDSADGPKTKHSEAVFSKNKGKFEGMPHKKFQKHSGNDVATEKPEDWSKFKKEKKELKLKRKQKRTGFDIIVKAKQLGEKLRCKTLKGGETERNGLINELHSMLKGQDLYPKLVLAHDTSRIVQWLLKYSSPIVKEQISKELAPVALSMLHSKYGVFCAKRLLKYGNTDTKNIIIRAMYGNAVKLSSHSVSAPVLEYAVTNHATNLHKQHLIQEFYGDLYKNSKDDSVKHLRDVYKNSPDLKQGTLGATKSNLLHVLNKNLLDSNLVQTVLNQFLSECSIEDRNEIVALLIPHIVVISNSKDGSRVAMQCIWHGTNKDRKSAMKVLKEHVVELSKHEHGHCTVITLLDAADDTVLLHKIIISELLKNARDLAINEWGRKVLLWLVAPSDSTCFHPVFVKELEEGRTNSTSKKSPEIRQKEILGYSIKTLLNLIEEEPEFWLKNSSLAYEMWTVIKAGEPDETKGAIQKIVDVIVQPDWKIVHNEIEICGIEDAGLHMIIKKLVKHKPDSAENSFGACLVEALEDETLQKWLALNRGCFVIVTIFENHLEGVQEQIKAKLKPFSKLLKKQTSKGAKILLQKIN